MKKTLFLFFAAAMLLFCVSPSGAEPFTEKMRHLLKDLPGWEGMEMVPIVTPDSGQGRAAVFTREYHQGRTLVVQALKTPGGPDGKDDFKAQVVDVSSERMRQGAIDGIRFAEIVYRVSPERKVPEATLYVFLPPYSFSRSAPEMIVFTLNSISGDDELFHLARTFDWKAILGALGEF
jgi:hypothetical protein